MPLQPSARLALLVFAKTVTVGKTIAIGVHGVDLPRPLIDSNCSKRPDAAVCKRPDAAAFSKRPDAAAFYSRLPSFAASSQ